MIVALLAAADPLSRVEHGEAPDSYEPLAEAVLAALRNGADARGLMTVIREHAAHATAPGVVRIELIRGFVEAAFDWWASAASRWDASVAS